MGTIDFKIDTADFVNKLRMDFNLHQSIANPKNIVQITGLTGGSAGPHDPQNNTTGNRFTFVVAATEQMADWSAQQLGIDKPDMVFVSTNNGLGGQALRGWKLTVDDLVFAPGYRDGKDITHIEGLLHTYVPDLPDGQIVDFEDDR